MNTPDRAVAFSAESDGEKQTAASVLSEREIEAQRARSYRQAPFAFAEHRRSERAELQPRATKAVSDGSRLGERSE